MKVWQNMKPDKNTNIDNPPTPCIVVAMDTFGAQVVREVMALHLKYLNSGQQITQFFYLSKATPETFSLCPIDLQRDDAYLDTAAGERNNVISDLQGEEETYRDAFQRAASNTNQIRMMLEKALHQAREHKRLISAGWNDTNSVPVNIFLLADGKDVVSAGYLLPMFGLLGELITDDLLCQSFFLLNIAVFPYEDYSMCEAHETFVLRLLRELDSSLHPESGHTARLSKMLKRTALNCRKPAVILFDDQKEGSALVKDQDGMRTMVGNALAALLTGRTARRLVEGQASEGDGSQGVFYSIGAVLVAEDPALAQAYCANQSAAEFLETQLLCEPANDPICEREADRISDSIGSLADWISHILEGIPGEIARFSLAPDNVKVSAGLAAPALNEIDFERITDLDWDVALQAHLEKLEEIVIPQLRMGIEENSHRLIEERRNLLHDGISRLPHMAPLYPGGLRAEINIMDRLLSVLHDRQAEMDQELLAAEKDVRRIREQIGNGQQQMRSLLAKAPALPWWVRLMPELFRKKIAPAWYLWRFRGSLRALYRIRRDMIGWTEQYAGYSVQQMMIERLKPLPEMLTAEIQEFKSFLEKAISDLKLDAERMAENIRAAEAGHHAAGWDSLFRVCFTSRAYINWGYQKMHPDFSGWLEKLLASSDVLNTGDGTFHEKVINWVFEQGMAAYELFWHISLDQHIDIMKTQYKDDLDFENISHRSLAACQPLLRPNFDTLGGGGASNLRPFALLGSPEWNQPWLSGPASDRWEVFYTGELQAAFYLQVRDSIPLAAFENGFAIGKRKLDELPSKPNREKHDRSNS